jgi:hypothetical protein
MLKEKRYIVPTLVFHTNDGHLFGASTLLFANSENSAMSVKAWLAGIFASAVLFASTAGSVIAQPPGGGRGGQGGGRGGMMMMGGGGGGGVMSMFSLLRIEKVQGEVKITDEEKAALEKAGEKIREMTAPAGGGGGFQNFRDMSEEERAKMMEEMQARMKKASEAAREEIEAILPPEKLSRLLGIFIQNTQSMQQVLTNPLVVDELELTDEQKEKVTKTGTELMEEMRSAMSELFGGGGGDRTAIQAKMDDFRKKGDEKYKSILTDDQKKKLEELKGAEFKLSPEEMGRGMFGGGRGPGGAGGRGGRGGEGGDAGAAPGGRGGRGQRPSGDGDIQ